jgi:NADPH:quinone reductase-like Zn-dependent oxidoreductase
MKAMVFHEHGSVDDLALETFPDPICGPRDAIIQVEATSLNGFDPMILGGTTGLKTPLPMVPCGDLAGTIAELGIGVDGSQWRVGDRVCPHPFVFGEGMTGETRLGAASEFVRIPASNHPGADRSQGRRQDSDSDPLALRSARLLALESLLLAAPDRSS